MQSDRGSGVDALFALRNNDGRDAFGCLPRVIWVPAQGFVGLIVTIRVTSAEVSHMLSRSCTSATWACSRLCVIRVDDTANRIDS